MRFGTCYLEDMTGVLFGFSTITKHRHMHDTTGKFKKRNVTCTTSLLAVKPRVLEGCGTSAKTVPSTTFSAAVAPPRIQVHSTPRTDDVSWRNAMHKHGYE